MPKHEFGIMDKLNPKKNYWRYEPEKYNALTIDDIYISELLPQFDDIPVYWCRYSRPATGMAYSGVTLIPPESALLYNAAVKSYPNYYTHRELIALSELFNMAHQESKFVIHFGI